jgi:hypothetical protein
VVVELKVEADDEVCFVNELLEGLDESGGVPGGTPLSVIAPAYADEFVGLVIGITLVADRCFNVKG